MHGIEYMNLLPAVWSEMRRIWQ